VSTAPGGSARFERQPRERSDFESDAPIESRSDEPTHDDEREPDESCTPLDDAAAIEFEPDERGDASRGARSTLSR
jgi:hypothetical protein